MVRPFFFNLFESGFQLTQEVANPVGMLFGQISPFQGIVSDIIELDRRRRWNRSFGFRIGN